MAENDDGMLHSVLERGLEMRRNGEAQAALDLLDLIVTNFAASDEPAHVEAVARALLGKAMALGDLGRGDEALETLGALRRGLADADGPPWHDLAILAEYEEAVMHSQKEDDEAAAERFAAALAREDGAEPASIRHILAACRFNLAVACARLGRVDQALAALDGLDAAFGDASDPALQRRVADGRTLRADLAAG